MLHLKQFNISAPGPEGGWRWGNGLLRNNSIIASRYVWFLPPASLMWWRYIRHEALKKHAEYYLYIQWDAHECHLRGYRYWQWEELTRLLRSLMRYGPTWNPRPQAQVYQTLRIASSASTGCVLPAKLSRVAHGKSNCCIFINKDGWSHAYWRSSFDLPDSESKEFLNGHHL